jgi:hypothetical protein
MICFSYPSTVSKLSLFPLVFLYVASRGIIGGIEGEELNHMTARKHGSLYIIQYSLVTELYLGTSAMRRLEMKK